MDKFEAGAGGVAHGAWKLTKSALADIGILASMRLKEMGDRSVVRAREILEGMVLLSMAKVEVREGVVWRKF